MNNYFCIQSNCKPQGGRRHFFSIMEKREFTFQNSEGDLIKKLALLGVRKRKEAANRQQVETEIGKKCYYTDIKTNAVNVYITLFKNCYNRAH